jgi:hypothetical protein
MTTDESSVFVDDGSRILGALNPYALWPDPEH